MKLKNAGNKLKLKKETVATLNSEQLKGIKGGVSRTCGSHFCDTIELTCNTCINTECACSNPCLETDC